MATRFRPLTIAMIAAAHAGALAAIVFGGIQVPVAATTAAIAIHEMTVPQAVAPPPPPITLAAIEPGVLAPSFEVAVSEHIAVDCQMSGTITTALANDPQVGSVLAASASANAPAVMIWDGRWAEGAAPIRRVVLERIRAAAPACRDAAIVGPRLLIVPTGATTVAVAVGSGTWRWAELLT